MSAHEQHIVELTYSDDRLHMIVHIDSKEVCRVTIDEAMILQTILSFVNEDQDTENRVVGAFEIPRKRMS
jgi:hypothetical protein